ncbi:MAG: methyltransferase domain-containing protein [Ignavibacteriaceae bacterium]
MNRLNLGCGNDIKDGYINLDVVDYGGNRIHDLNSFPYPFEDSFFDEVFASHILEHLNNFHEYITEIYRILKPDGVLIVYAPFFLNTKYFGEPDHKIPFSIRTFDNYEYIGNKKLKFYEKWKLKHRTNFITSHFPVLKWLDFFVNLEPVIYERFLAGLFSPEEVFFKLRAIK